MTDKKDVLVLPNIYEEPTKEELELRLKRLETKFENRDLVTKFERIKFIIVETGITLFMALIVLRIVVYLARHIIL